MLQSNLQFMTAVCQEELTKKNILDCFDNLLSNPKKSELHKANLFTFDSLYENNSSHISFLFRRNKGGLIADFSKSA